MSFFVRWNTERLNLESRGYFRDGEEELYKRDDGKISFCRTQKEVSQIHTQIRDELLFSFLNLEQDWCESNYITAGRIDFVLYYHYATHSMLDLGPTNLFQI